MVEDRATRFRSQCGTLQCSCARESPRARARADRRYASPLQVVASFFEQPLFREKLQASRCCLASFFVGATILFGAAFVALDDGLLNSKTLHFDPRIFLLLNEPARLP